jgi:hypothetical protein
MTPPADTTRYKNHRFPGAIISHGVWLYYRFTLSYRDAQELLFERGITVSHEAIRQWCRKFGQDYANRLRLILDSRGLCDEQLNERMQQCCASLSGVVHKLQETQVAQFIGVCRWLQLAYKERRVLLGDSPLFTRLARKR